MTKKKSKEEVRSNTIIRCVVAICVLIIEVYALSKGINGTMMGVSLLILGGLAGVGGKKIKEVLGD